MKTFLTILFFHLLLLGSSQTTETFSSSGTWVVPCGVYSVTVECWGAGGAGGGNSINDGTASSGGGGGAYASAIIAVVPGANISYIIGSGGIAGTGNGGNGSNTSFNGGSVIAEGGRGGGANGAAPGIGGSILGSIGTTIYSGGSGHLNIADIGGGGGGSAGSISNGNTATSSLAGGPVVDGYAGGNGGLGDNFPGNTPPVGSYGGGGGGSGNASSGGLNGGSGNSGLVRITYSTTSKTWVSGATWSTAVWTPVGSPTSSENVLIPNGCNLINDVPLATVCNLTIASGGSLTSTSPISCLNTFTIEDGGEYVHDNTVDPFSTIFSGTESFADNSTIVIQNWFDYNTPLGIVTSSFGNITYDNAARWDHDGTFGGSIQKIKGKLTIMQGTWVFDDGTGASSELITDEITVNSTGTLIFQEGFNRNLDLTNRNISCSGSIIGMNESIGALIWNVSESMTVLGTVVGMESSGTPMTVGTCNFNVGTQLSCGSTSSFTLANQIDGNIIANIGDSLINISSNPIFFNNSLTSTSVTNVDIDGLTTNTGVLLVIANTSGSTTIDMSGYTQSGSSSFYGQYNGANSTTTNYLGTTLSLQGGSFYMTNGAGTLNITTTGQFQQSGGTIFRGMNDQGGVENGVCNITFNSLDYNGGNTIFNNSLVTNGTTTSLSITNSCDVNFSGADVFIGFGVLSPFHNGVHDFNVGGNLIIGGTTRNFLTSASGGDETVDITGDLTINAGNIWMVGNETFGLPHNITTTIGGNVTINGGTVIFSGKSGNNLFNVSGSFSVTDGEVIFKDEDGSANITIGGNFSQSGGTIYLHKDAANATSDISTISVNGDFSHTGGVLNFDQNTSSTATNTLTLNGSNITLSGTGTITHGGEGVNTTFGEIYINPTTGSSILNRFSDTHQINQTRLILNASKVLNLSAGSNNIQLACNDLADDAVPASITLFDIYGQLNLDEKQIYGRSEGTTYRPTSLRVRNGGKIVTGLIAGFYDGTNLTSLNYRTKNITNGNNAVNSMNWYLDPLSTITYERSSDQTVTGIYPKNFASNENENVNSTVNSGYKYGILEINNLGFIGTHKCAPASDNIFIRNELKLTRGEYFLSGYTTVIESNLPAAISGGSPNAYIESESESGIILWEIGANTGVFMLPFGYNGDIVPFVMNLSSGVVGGNLQVSTWFTLNNTTPPSGTTICSTLPDPDEQYAIDRFLNVESNIAGYVGSAEIYYIEGELDGITESNLQGQKWDDNLLTSCKWELPEGVVDVVNNKVTVSSFDFDSPWVLSNGPTPLPIELLSFNTKINNQIVDINWQTTAEINNNYFLVQRSSDLLTWESIDQVEGKGNSNILSSYYINDKAPLRGISYYRLKQVDYDGSFSFSNIESVNFKVNNKVILYPNPTTGRVKINLLEEYQEVYIILKNALGQELKSLKYNNTKDIDFQINANNGWYYVELITAESNSVIKVLKQ